MAWVIRMTWGYFVASFSSHIFSLYCTLFLLNGLNIDILYLVFHNGLCIGVACITFYSTSPSQINYDRTT